jgi:hypothetical protein
MFVSNICSAMKAPNSAKFGTVFFRDWLKQAERHIILGGTTNLIAKVVACMKVTEARHVHPASMADDRLRADAELLGSPASVSAANKCEGGK